jgi:para-aminobenzoate synthetase
MQGIVEYFGGKVIKAPTVMHGRLSKIKIKKEQEQEEEDLLMKNLPLSFEVVRYHSWMVSDIPNCIKIIATTTEKEEEGKEEEEEEVIMAIRHKELPIWGVQFHPESICTECGFNILSNFFDIVVEWKKSNSLLSLKNNINNNNNNNNKIEAKSNHSIELDKIILYNEISSSSTTTTSTTSSTSSSSAGCKLFWRCIDKSISITLNSELVFLNIINKHNNNNNNNNNSSKLPHFWLDSAKVEEGRSRFSYMGISTIVYKYYISNKLNIFEKIQSILDERKVPSLSLPFDFNCGLVGYFGYEMRQDLRDNNNINNIDNVDMQGETPDAYFMLADEIIVFDHSLNDIYLLSFSETQSNYEKSEKWLNNIEQELKLLSLSSSTSKTTTTATTTSKTTTATTTTTTSSSSQLFTLTHPKKDYLNLVDICKNYIKQGETYEICLTNHFRSKLNTSISSLNAYLLLRKQNPAPYAAYIYFNDELSIVSCSPERFLKINNNKIVESKPIKGTRPRGVTNEEDEKIKISLSLSEKDRAENLMIVDLIRNDLGYLFICIFFLFI